MNKLLLYAKSPFEIALKRVIIPSMTTSASSFPDFGWARTNSARKCFDFYDLVEKGKEIREYP
jgi:hypothetical protein